GEPAVKLKVTTVPSGAETKPEPVSWSTVAVITWFSPTLLVAVSGLILILASTYAFVAGPLPPGPELPEVLRVTGIAGLPRFAVADALAVNVPVVLLLMVIVQVAISPTNAMPAPQVVLCDDGAGLTLGVMFTVPAGTPAGNLCTVTVKTCSWPTSLVAVFGAMAMLMST